MTDDAVRPGGADLSAGTTAAVVFRVLGPVGIDVDGAPVPAPPGHRLRILAALVAAWGRTVPVDDLVELVWDRDPPPAAVNSLRAQMSRLRTRLAEVDPGLGVETPEGGYALATGDAVLDREVFLEHQRVVRRAAAAADHQRVVHAADQGLALWRGPAFGALADLHPLRAQAVHLDEERSVMVELRAAALLQLGDLEVLVADLAAEVARSPLREELRRLHMIALARTGRRAEASRTYDDYHRRLTEIGIEPGPALSELHWRILDNDPLLVAGTASPHRRDPERPLPPELTLTAPLAVGRAGATAELESALAAAAAGGRVLAVVRGEVGVGKSHLVASIARRAHDAGALVLAGVAEDAVRAPLGPVVRALRFFREHGDAAGDELLAPWWSELARLLPEVPREAPVDDAGLDPVSARARLFDAVVGWLGSASPAAPLVLVLEDLQWADETTLLLLEHLVRATDLTGVLLLATVREPEPATSPRLEDVLAVAHRLGVLATDLTLEGLGVDEVAELVAETWDPEEVDGPALATALVERTNGNPLFVLELLTALAPSGPPPRDRDPRHLLATPPSAAHLVARRLRQLDPLGSRVLSDAALIGDDVGFDLLTATVGLGPDEVLRALDGPIDMGLLLHLPGGGGRLRFAHAVVRDALVERLRPAARLDGHRRIAEAIAELPAHRREALVEERADHASAAAMVLGPAVALPAVLGAADQAVERRAFAHAAGWYGRACELAEEAGVPDGPADGLTRFDLLCALGGAQRQAGDAAARDAILAAAGLARDADDHEALAEAALLGTRGFFRQVAVADDDWIALLEDAVADGGPVSAEARARLLASLASELVWAEGADRRFAMSDEAVALARASGSSVTLGQVLMLRLVTVWAPDTVEDRLATAAEIVALTDRTRDRAVLGHALRFGAAAAIESGDHALATMRLEACTRLTDELGQVDLAWHLALAEAGWTLLHGDLDAAKAATRGALAAGERAGEPEAASFSMALELEIRRLRGTAGAIVDALVPLLDDLPHDPARGLLRHLAAAGHLDVVRPRLAAEVAALEDLGWGVHTLAALTNLADVAGRLADRPAAEALRPLLAPFADRFPQAIVVQPVAHHALGVLASVLDDRPAAEAHFAAAVEHHRVATAPLFEAESLLAWGHWLDRDDHTEAGRRLADARGAAGLLAGPRG